MTPVAALVVITRKVRFSAGHHLALPELTDAENFDHFWKASLREGHGHNYIAEIGVEGPIDPTTGMVLNLSDLKQLLAQHITDEYDFKNLNAHPDFETYLPAIENICCVLWRRLQPSIRQLPGGDATRLRWITVSETDTLWGSLIAVPNTLYPSTDTALTAEAEPNERLVHTFTKVLHFSASHRLHNPQLDDATNRQIFGKCNNANGHGHNYELHVTLTGPQDPRTGLIVDLWAFEKALETHVMEPFDHKHLNLDVACMAGLNPTAEVITSVLWDQLNPHIPQPARLFKLRLVESTNNAVEYYGPNGPTLEPTHLPPR
ncbi:MAG: 6-carboxytetrahydropterin synthase [Vampirovibrionales bacterium]|nr:6-carboxytetrahydropterin synthase [Vampirovibrionales bacterium]